MAADKKVHTHPEFALKVLGALPAEMRKTAELKGGDRPYTILKVRGKSIASIRDAACRIVHPHDGTAQDAKDLAKMIAAAAPSGTKADKPKPEGDTSKGE